MKLKLFVFVTFLVSVLNLYASSSYRDLIMNSDTEHLFNLSKECNQSLLKHIINKMSFKTEVLNKYLTKLAELDNEQQSENSKFYHYTNYENIKSISLNKKFDDLFLGLRNPKRIAPMDWNLYLAGDDSSSKNYGNIKTRFSIDLNSFVLDLLYYYDGDDSNLLLHSRKNVIQDIENSLVSKFPYLSSCLTDFPEFGKLSYPENVGLLTQLALIDSNVSLIAYYGLKNTSKKAEKMNSSGMIELTETPVYWYQLTDAKFIKNIEILN